MVESAVGSNDGGRFFSLGGSNISGRARQLKEELQSKTSYNNKNDIVAKHNGEEKKGDLYYFMGESTILEQTKMTTEEHENKKSFDCKNTAFAKNNGVEDNEDAFKNVISKTCEDGDGDMPKQFVETTSSSMMPELSPLESMKKDDEIHSYDTHPCLEKGEPTLVYLDFLYVHQLADFNCKNCSTYISVLIWVHWFDPRLVDYKKTILPVDLWTPRLQLGQAMGDFQVDLRECYLADKKTGCIRTMTEYRGTVRNPMLEIANFPFDLDRIELTFNACAYKLRNTDEENVAFKTDYRFLVDAGWKLTFDQSSKTRNRIGTGKFEMKHKKNDSSFTLPEWKVVGIEGRYINPDHVQDIFQLDILVQRRSKSHLMKTLLPLNATVALGWSTVAIDPDDLSTRLELITALLLAQFAFMFLVNEDLPNAVYDTKTGLTTMDWVTSAGLLHFMLFGALSAVLKASIFCEKTTILQYAIDCEDSADIVTENLNLFLFFQPVLFFVIEFVILVHARWQRNRKVLNLKANGFGVFDSDEEYYNKMTIDEKTKKDFEEKIYSLTNFEKRWDEVVLEAKEMIDNAPDYSDSLKKAEKKGIKILTQKKKRALSWKEWRNLAKENGMELPTRNELAESGIFHGTMDFWNPVRQENDSDTADYVQMGTNFVYLNEKYISYGEKFSPVNWDGLGLPYTWKPLDFIYAKTTKQQP